LVIGPKRLRPANRAVLPALERVISHWR